VTKVPRWTGDPWVRTSHYGGAERRVVVFRPLYRRRSASWLLLLGGAAAVWAALTYVAALVANRRLALGFVESVGDSDFQLVLLACGLMVWVGVGVPLLFGTMLVREVRDRMLARAVTGELVFRGVFDPRRAPDDGRRPEFYVAIDDGTAERLPAYRIGQWTVSRFAEGDVVRASVTRTGVLRVLHLTLLEPAPPPP
jgi:hypothetical protein